MQAIKENSAYLNKKFIICVLVLLASWDDFGLKDHWKDTQYVTFFCHCLKI